MALLIAGMALMLAGCGGALDPKGNTAGEQYFLIMLSFLIMAFVMVVVFGLFFFVIIRYRKRKGQTGYPKQIEGSHKLEIIWTTIPFLLIVTLAVFTVSFTFKHDKIADPEESINVKVIAHQFWWEFIYTDHDIRTAQDLVLPEHTMVTVELTSADVIHSFWIPQLVGKMDTNPGLTRSMSFDSGEPNVYLGKCAELCGTGHALMDFKAVVVSDAEFDAWVNKMKAPTPAAVTPAEQAGEEIFRNNCISCHAITVDTMSAGPNLTGFASRETVGGFRENNDKWLKEWILHPQEVKPGATMPAFEYLSNDEVDNLIQFLRTLK